MRKLPILVTVVVLVLGACEANPGAGLADLVGGLFLPTDEIPPPPINVEPDEDGEIVYQSVITTDLVAGWDEGDAHYAVGEVRVQLTEDPKSGHLLATVKFSATEPWVLTDSRIWVADELEELPDSTGSGTPTSGEPDQDPAPTSSEQYHSFDLTALAAEASDFALAANEDGILSFYVAAHAQVAYELSALDSFVYVLPDDPVSIVLSDEGELDSYFSATLSEGGDLDDTYRAWCVDPSRQVPTGQSLQMTLVSSYTDDTLLLEQLIGSSHNIDALNYVINSTWAATPMDLQVAIWQLADPGMFTYPPGSDYDPEVVEQIVSTALQEGEGFVPGVGQKIAAIADPNNLDPGGTVQILILEMPVTTTVTLHAKAWASGTQPDGPIGTGMTWVMYFQVEQD